MDPVAAAPRHCPSCNDCCHVRRTDRTQALGRRPSVPGAAEAAEPPEIRTGRNIRSSDEILASWVRILPLLYCSPRSHQLSDLSCPIFVAASFPYGDASRWNLWQPLPETVPLATIAAIFKGLNPSPVSGCCPLWSPWPPKRCVVKMQRVRRERGGGRREASRGKRSETGGEAEVRKGQRPAGTWGNMMKGKDR